MARSIKSVEVNTASSSYIACIGENYLPERVAETELFKKDRVALVVSSRVYDLHGAYINEAFASLNNTELLIMEDCEENKSYSYAEKFLDSMVKAGLTRNSAVVGIGGGVVGDFAGYLASLYMRGIDLYHVPTTLLSMVDSSIGGKVAVNLSVGKNIAGAFHQPSAVITDVRFLSTLPENEIRNGFAEILKHGVIGEKDTFSIMEENNLESIQQPDILAEIIYRSVMFKASVVMQDERESGIRAILNYGHTVGHAIESFMCYRGISHGEAVAIGIMVELYISQRLGMVDEAEYKRVEEIIDRYMLMNPAINPDKNSIVEHMKYDKKNKDNKVKFVLLNGLFNPVFDVNVNEEILTEAMGKFF